MTKAIHVEAGPGSNAEFLFKVTLPIQALASEGFARWDIAIRFFPPAADDIPAALRHALLDLREHRRVRLFHPLIERGRTGDEDKVREFLHAVERGAEGGFDLVETLLPLP